MINLLVQSLWLHDYTVHKTIQWRLTIDWVILREGLNIQKITIWSVAKLQSKT